MTSDELLNMYELFYTTKAKGSGIGMSLSKQMIEENHGTIEVRSEKYQGTTVRLIFGGEL
jgi:polar amino acid transport system substrate-binding protein